MMTMMIIMVMFCPIYSCFKRLLCFATFQSWTLSNTLRGFLAIRMEFTYADKQPIKAAYGKN